MTLITEGTSSPEVTDRLIERISALDLSAIETSLQAEGMQADQIDWAIESYRQFLTIAALFPGIEFAPSTDTDLAWHAHIDSVSYDDDVASVFGERPFVHNAGLGEQPAELPRLFEAWENTLLATKYVFGDASLLEINTENTQPAYCDGGGGVDLIPAACSAVPPEVHLGGISLVSVGAFAV